MAEPRAQNARDICGFDKELNRDVAIKVIDLEEAYGMDKNYRVWVLHGENPCTDPVVEPVIEEENTEAEGLGMGNFVDASYGVHEVVACDLNEDEENHMGDFEPPPVLEPDLGKRYNEYKKMA
ncbi:hypothetical protein IFM89_030871 [Coptis chinensis]|uniref:Uncharacterized protein n=1 Tax=Coptis chinensis TaxID=261450 RepID=A0A835LC92_9MAGN|nr:hypothetical protein IFM89_030871 [Coptis chinensis]